MDSLSQMALGAAVGALVGGKCYGKKAALIGAICGTIPDMDVFIPYGDPISNFTYHRGFTHSFLFCFLATPFLAWIFTRLKWIEAHFKDRRLLAMIFAILVTHIFLDAMTIYGTQFFWPSSIPPVGIGSIFIIDLFYTIPLLIGVVWFCLTKNHRANHVGLIISTLYLLWSFGAQHYVLNLVQQQIDDPQAQILVQPTPFNTLLWRVLVMEEGQYRTGYLSLLDQERTLQFKTFDNDKNLVAPIADSFAVSRLDWFTKGFYGVRVENDSVVISDLRMGLEPDQYVFQFIIAKQGSNGQLTEIPNESYKAIRDLSRLNRVWERIWDQSVEF